MIKISETLFLLNKKISTWLFENKSIYVGCLYLKFERFPYYSGQSRLNSILLNLGFTKLVTRLIVHRFVKQKNKTLVELTQKRFLWADKIDENKKNLVIKYTEGVFEDLWVDNREPKEDFTLTDCFQTKNGVFIGEADRGWWFYENNMVVTDKHPHGCAKKIKKEYYKNRIFQDKEIEGFYGYTHRGGYLFKIGDKLFEERFNLTQPNDLLKTEYQAIIKKHKNKIKNHENIEDTYEFIKSHLCFNKRGYKTIETWEEAEQAAINLSKYLS